MESEAEQRELQLTEKLEKQIEQEVDRCERLQEERDVMQAEMNRVAQMHEDLEKRNVCCEACGGGTYG